MHKNVFPKESRTKLSTLRRYKQRLLFYNGLYTSIFKALSCRNITASTFVMLQQSGWTVYAVY